MTGTPDVRAATDALRAEAELWNQLRPRVRKIATRVDGLRVGRLEAGIFQVLVDAYSEVVDVVVARAAEGESRCGQVAATLRAAADTYDAEEQAAEHRLRGLY